MVGMADAAGCFAVAGFVQFLLLNKNCTRAGGLQIVCRLLLISRAVRNAFCLSAKRYEVSGGRWLWPLTVFRGIGYITKSSATQDFMR